MIGGATFFKIFTHMSENPDNFSAYIHGRHSANRGIGRLIYIEYPAIWAIGLLIGLVLRLLRVKRLI